jgi:flagellar motor protein MotB
MPKLTLPPEVPGFAAPSVRRFRTERRHKGAWKVAYADFVTALMALFIVLWMMNASGAVKQSLQSYFKDPRAYAKQFSSGATMSAKGDENKLQDVESRIEQALRQMPEFRQISKNVVLSVTRRTADRSSGKRAGYVLRHRKPRSHA